MFDLPRKDNLDAFLKSFYIKSNIFTRTDNDMCRMIAIVHKEQTLGCKDSLKHFLKNGIPGETLKSGSYRYGVLSWGEYPNTLSLNKN